MKELDQISNNYEILRKKNDKYDSIVKDIISKYDIDMNKNTGPSKQLSYSRNFGISQIIEKKQEKTLDNCIEQINATKKINMLKEKYKYNNKEIQNDMLTNDINLNQKQDSLAKAQSLVDDIKRRYGKKDTGDNENSDQNEPNTSFQEPETIRKSLMSKTNQNDTNNIIDKSNLLPGFSLDKTKNSKNSDNKKFSNFVKPKKNIVCDAIKQQIRDIKTNSPYIKAKKLDERRSKNINLKLKTLEFQNVYEKRSTNDILDENMMESRRARSRPIDTAKRVMRTFFLSEIKLPKKKKLIIQSPRNKKTNQENPQNFRDTLPSVNNKSQQDQLTTEFISVRASDAKDFRQNLSKPNNKSIISKYKNSMFNDTVMSYSKEDIDNSTLRDVNLFGSSVKESMRYDKSLLQSRLKEINQTIRNLENEKVQIDVEMLDICENMFPKDF